MPTSSRSSSAIRKGGAPTAAGETVSRNDGHPIVGQRGREIQAFGSITRIPIGLSEKVCKASVAALNQVLADTMTLRDLYKKHHWQVSGHTFYSLHLLFDKHYEEQAVLVDAIAERIQILGGVAVAMAHDVAELSSIPRVPRDREEPPVQVSRLLDGHQRILKNCHDYASKADDAGDDGTNDLIVSQLVRTNEMQVWFVACLLYTSPSPRDS